MSRRWLYWLGAAGSVCSAFFFVRAVASHWRAIAPGNWDEPVYVAAGLALLLYVSTYVTATRAWQLGLRVLGSPVRFAELARILMVSQIAKYLPGNIGHHVGRVMLAREFGLETRVVVTSMFLDTVLVLLAGAACSLPAVALLLAVIRQHGSDMQRVSVVGLLAAVVAIAIVMALPVARRKAAVVMAPLTTVRSIAGAGRLAEAWLNHCLSFLLGASALYFLCNALGSGAAASGPAQWLEVTGAYAAAWLAGFLMPGAPAGLGVRELVLLLGLSPIVGTPQATAAAAVLRLVTTAGDGGVFALAMLQRRYAGRQVRI